MLNALLAFSVSLVIAQEKVQVKNVTPQGYVKSVDQIRIEFAKPMVKFGEINLAFPAKSNCFQGGQGRWVDTRNWVYDFKETLPGGKSCGISVGDKDFKFNTGGSHIVSVFPRQYRPIEPDQNFILILDSPVKKDTVAKGAYFVVAGLGDRIPLQVVEGSEANKVKAAAEKEYKYEDEELKKKYWIVVKSSRLFPPQAEVSLVWGKEVQSESGSTSPEPENFAFTVVEPFKASFSCEREAANKPCVPILGFRLSFSGSISTADAKKIYLEGADKNKIYASGLDDPKDRTTLLEFKGPYPQKAEYQLVIPSGLKDENGRELSNKAQFPLKVKTGEDPALLKFSASFGLLEAGPEAAIAVTLRRVEKSLSTQFMGWTGQLTADKFAQILKVLNEIENNPYDSTRLKSMKSFPAKKIQVQKPLKASDVEVVGIPLKENGFYAVEIESPLLGQSLLDKKTPYFVRTAALVTSMTTHVKYNDDEAWVWVTRLQDAHVVDGAKIKIYDVKGQEVAQGISGAQGMARLKFNKPVSKLPNISEGRYTSGFFVVAEKGNDFTFTHSSWDNGIENWRFQLGLYGGDSGVIGHAILDRTLFRPEEKLSAKILIRKTAEKGLSLPSGKEWPSKVSFNHESGVQNFDLPLKWNKKTGVALVNWALPAGIKMGSWSMTLKVPKGSSDLNVGQFSVDAFRIPLMQVQIQGQPEYMLEKNIALQSQVRYFSGGAAPNLPIKVRWSVEPDGFVPQDSDLQDYSFANGSVKEGVFRSGEDEGARHIPQAGTLEVKTNDQGVADIKINSIKYSAGPQRLRAEVEYKDPNGEIKNSVRSFGLWPSQLVLGIKTKSWWATQSSVEFEVVALDVMQKPQVGQKVQVDLYTSNYYSHRKRLVGGFYAYEDFTENKKIGELCRGETNAQGLFSCVGQSKVSGSVLAVVRSKDSKGRESFARVNQWIVKPGENQWFGSDDHDRADLIPFRKSYDPGEVAELQLRTPFPEAKVLVTVERDSILYSEVIDVKGDRPVIKVPIKKEYAPNVVISAFAVRGRLNGPKPTALIDLGKPSMKLGMANVRVGLKENTLKVSVQSDRKTYKARDKSQITVKVQDFKGRPAANGEVVLVAVDEGLLELRDNKSWNLLQEMMKMREHRMEFATAQTLVIGRRHFGLKALPIGGDGGGGLRRELFDSLLYWNPSVKLNAQGEAKVEVPLNDSTTSFRIVAIATQGLDEFGTGWTSIQSSQDIMIMPGLAGVARQGDDFAAGFTVRNATKEKQQIAVSLKTLPDVSGFGVQMVSLSPGESKEVQWNIKVPVTASLDYIVTAKTPQGKFLDEIKKAQKVLPVRVARVYQSEWGQWPEFSKLSLQAPEGASQKSLVFEVSEGLGGSTTGLKEYWENYYYNCLEQQVSKAVSLKDKKLWSQISAKFGSYLDSNGLLKYFPSSTEGSVILTAYVLSVANEAGLEIDDGIEDRMLYALSQYAEGRLKTNDFSYADGNLRKVMVFEALSRHRRLNLDLLTSIEYLPSQWPLHTLVEWYQILLWEKDAPNRAKELQNLESILRNKFYFSAKRLQLRDEGLEKMPWMMRDTESALIRLVLTTMSQESWQSDVPRLYSGLISRQENGNWQTTTNNAWGRVMMDKVKQKYSKDKVEGSFSFKLGTQTATHSWAKAQEGAYELPWQTENLTTWNQQGAGKPWITVSVKAAVPVTKPIFAGFNVEKTITPVNQKKKGAWSVGDVAKVTLKVKTPAPQSWVVIEDPVPAGASILQSSFATATERKEELIRSYYSWFNSEETMEYTIRFNQPGAFVLPISRVEAMYSPDLFAELPESQWVIEK
ncbi:hypothetical protein AZI86_08070 [Bdellovibrio bacteriovorus]|uniref:Alpha-2-macroglobulin n=1 Tax=Bdellovibrio bacteriovorus TaxID=959 RepID=A0A150WT03_BDEBC|nr:hypothetical protein AZI86_08070 [Bdellovibrio bacteriovorus]